jgi:hypothetical protein
MIFNTLKLNVQREHFRKIQFNIEKKTSKWNFPLNTADVDEDVMNIVGTEESSTWISIKLSQSKTYKKY